MNFGFKYMEYNLPSLISVEDIIGKLNYSSNMLNKIKEGGLLKIPANNNILLTNLIRDAVVNILTKEDSLQKKIKNIYLAHSLPFLSSANFPFFEHCFKGLGFENIPKIALSGQPCSILHFATYLSGLELDNYGKNEGVLIIGADKAYSNKERVFFNSAMGDAVFVGFLTKNIENNQILTSYTHTNIIAYNGEKSDNEQIDKYRATNPSLIRLAIETALKQANLSINDIKYIVPHTPYNQIWDSIAILMKISRRKFLTNYISETGHLNSNDSFIHYIRAVRENLISKGEIALLINPGFGGTRGITIIKR